MAKTSTSTLYNTETSMSMNNSPRPMTLNFIRQFAKAYTFIGRGMMQSVMAN